MKTTSMDSFSRQRACPQHQPSYLVLLWATVLFILNVGYAPTLLAASDSENPRWSAPVKQPDFVSPRTDLDDDELAFVALARCLPTAARTIEDISPMLWVLEHNKAWRGYSNVDFGDCVRKYSADEPGWSQSPDTERGRRAASKLATKFGDYLMKHGCNGSGTNDCLTLLYGLLELVPASPRLPEIFERLAPDFSSSSTPQIPPELAGKREAHQGKDWEAAQSIRRQLMTRVIYLTLRLDMLAMRPNEQVLPGEPAATLTQLFPLAEALLLLDRIQGTLWPTPRIGSQYPFANPWETLPKTDGFPIWDRALADLGRKALSGNRDTLCAAPIDSLNSLPKAYWRGYWLAMLEFGRHDCPPSGETGWVATYRAATSADDPALAAFAPLRAYLGNENRADAHLAMVLPLAGHCPLKTDPWKICTWAGDKALRGAQSLDERRLPVPHQQRFRAELLFANTQVLDQLPGEVKLAALLARLERREARPLPDVRASLIQLAQQSHDWLEHFSPFATQRWWHPNSTLRALELDLPVDAEHPEENQRGLLVYGPDVAPHLVRLPGGFGQYDDGNMVTLSDLDGDTRLEAWFAAEWGECDGEDSVPGENCAITSYYLGGEVFGDRLGPYIAGPLPKPQSGD